MSVMDVMRSFITGSGSGPQSNTPAQMGTANQIQTPGQQASVNAVGNNTIPASGDAGGIKDNPIAAFPTTTNAGESKSPLESYGDLFKVDPANKDNPPASLVPNFMVDPAAIQAAVSKIDFTKSLSPEVLDKASKGDPVALATLINQAGQAGFAQSLMATGNIVKDALTKQADAFHGKIMPDILRRHEISVENSAKNPWSTNPAVAPLFQMVENQLASKFPTASASEIRTHAETYFNGMAGEMMKSQGLMIIDPKQQGGSVNRGANMNSSGGTDWDKWVGA